MAKDDDEIDTTFYIPDNYTNSGLILGFFKTRNLIEACAFAVVPAYLTLSQGSITIGFVPSILITIFVFLPLAIVCITGINGDPFTVFLLNVFKFLKHRKKMRFKRIKAPTQSIRTNEKKANIRSQNNRTQTSRSVSTGRRSSSK